MHRSIWQRWLSRFLGAGPAHSPVRRFRRPLLDTLEGRLTPATFAPTVFTDLAISSLAAVNGLGQITDQGNAITLRSALIAANANGNASTDTIQLLAGTYTLSISGNIGGSGTGEGATGNALLGDLDVTAGNLIVAGAGISATTIQQTTPALGTPSNDRVFEVNPLATAGAFEVGFHDLAITGGKTPDGGGAIASRAAGNVLNITRVKFDSNTSLAGGGGALLVDGGGDLNVSDSVFSSNISQVSGGGAIAMDGGATGANLQVSGASFVGNHGDSDGGAIELAGAFSATSSITTSSFANNQALGATATGGAIDFAGTNAVTLPVQRNRFVGNTAANGSALHTSSAAAFVVDADNNWWGASTGPAVGAVVVEAGSNLALDTWLQLRFSAAPTSLLVGGTSALTADLLGRNTGGPLAAGSLVGLPSVAATFDNATLGSLSGATALVGGVATATYTATDANGGTGGADATVDGETLSVSFNIAAAPHVPTVAGASTTVATQTTTGLVVTVNALDGAEVTHFRISNLVNGKLFKFDGTTELHNGDFITVAEGSDGLKFTPTAGLGSLASTFSFDVQAAQGTSGAGLSPAATASIGVADVVAPDTSIDTKPASAPAAPPSSSPSPAAASSPSTPAPTRSSSAPTAPTSPAAARPSRSTTAASAPSNSSTSTPAASSSSSRPPTRSSTAPTPRTSPAARARRSRSTTAASAPSSSPPCSKAASSPASSPPTRSTSASTTRASES